MIEKAAQTEIVLRFEDGWIDMHKRDGDECVHAAAAQHNTPCEQEAVAESVNEERGRALKIDGPKTSVRFEPAKLDEDDSWMQVHLGESESIQKSEKKIKKCKHHTPKRAAAFYL